MMMTWHRDHPGTGAGRDHLIIKLLTVTTTIKTDIRGGIFDAGPAAAGSPVSDLMEGDRSVINFDRGQEPAAHVLINGPWECGWCWFLSNISGGPLSYNKWPVNITPCAPPGEREGRGRAVRNPSWILLLSFDMFCVGVSPVSYRWTPFLSCPNVWYDHKQSTVLIATKNKHRPVMCHQPPVKTVKLENLILTTWLLNIASFINWGKMHFTFWYKFVQFYTICVIVIAWLVL